MSSWRTSSSQGCSSTAAAGAVLAAGQHPVEADQARRRLVLAEAVDGEPLPGEAERARRQRELQRHAVARRPAQQHPVHPGVEPQGEKAVLLEPQSGRRPAVDHDLGRHEGRGRPGQGPGGGRGGVQIGLDLEPGRTGAQGEPRQLEAVRRAGRRPGQPLFELGQQVRPRRRRLGRGRLLGLGRRGGKEGKEGERQDDGGGGRHRRWPGVVLLVAGALGGGLGRPRRQAEAAAPAEEEGGQEQPEGDAQHRQDERQARRNQVEPQLLVGPHRTLPAEVVAAPAPRRHARAGLHHRVGIGLLGAFHVGAGCPACRPSRAPRRSRRPIPARPARPARSARRIAAGPRSSPAPRGSRRRGRMSRRRRRRDRAAGGGRCATASARKGSGWPAGPPSGRAAAPAGSRLRRAAGRARARPGGRAAARPGRGRSARASRAPGPAGRPRRATGLRA